MKPSTQSISSCRGWFAFLSLVITASGCQNPDTSDGHGEDGAIAFRQIKPVLEKRCLPCHQGSYMGAPILDLRTPGELTDATRVPRLIVPGNPEASYLLAKVELNSDEEIAMPPIGHDLTPEEKEWLSEWIRLGAFWPEGEVLTSAVIRHTEP